MIIKKSFKKYFEYHQGLEKSEELLEYLDELINENDPRVIEIISTMSKVNDSLIDTIEAERKAVDEDYKVFNNLFKEYNNLLDNQYLDFIWNSVYLFALVTTTISASIFGKEAVHFISNVCFITIVLRALFVFIPSDKVKKYVKKMYNSKR